MSLGLPSYLHQEFFWGTLLQFAAICANRTVAAVVYGGYLLRQICSTYQQNAAKHPNIKLISAFCTLQKSNHINRTNCTNHTNCNYINYIIIYII